jgi:hypothetical protein
MLACGSQKAFLRGHDVVSGRRFGGAMRMVRSLASLALAGTFRLAQSVDRQGAGVWNAWRREHPSIRPNLSEADPAEPTPRGADLSKGTNLRGGDLSKGTNLLGANRAGSVCLDRFSGLIGGVSAGFRPPRSAAGE